MQASQSVIDLAAERHRLYADFNSREFDNDEIDWPQFAEIDAVEAKLIETTFETAADRQLGNLILMEDKPSRWDNFQENLFLRMQRFT